MKKLFILLLFCIASTQISAQSPLDIKVCANFWKDTSAVLKEGIIMNLSFQDGPFITVVIPDTTDISGCATFPISSVPVGIPYQFTGKLIDTSITGITILDLVAMTRHILGIEPLNGHPVFAADANRSGTVTAFDIVLLRKRMLGEPSVNYGPDWYFVQQNCTFQPNNPYYVDCPNIPIDSLPFMINVPLLGWKYGDVDGDALTGLIPPIDSVIIEIPNTILKAGQSIKIPTYLPYNTTEFAGFQLGFKVDTTLATLEQIVDASQIGDFNFNYKLPNGEVKILGNNIVDPNQDTLFYVQIKSKVDVPLKDVLKFTQTDFPSMIIPTQDLKNYYKIGLGFSTPVSTISPSIPINEVLVSPNPYREEATISFNLTNEEKVILEMIDLSGRMIYSATYEMLQGKNKIVIPDTAMTAGSMAVYRLTTPSGIVTGKIMKQ
jgi:Dockerin type I domain